MIQKIKDFCKRNKDDILLGIIVSLTGIVVVGGIFCYTLVIMSNDLVGVIDSKNTEIQDLKEEVKSANIKVNLANSKIDELEQTYEDVIPKQQYLDDIEYLESVIYELRYQCELDIKKTEEACNCIK